MAQRVPLDQPDEVIRCLEMDGGVIITGFSSVEDVEKVNADAAPFIKKIVEDWTTNAQEPGTARCYRLFGRSEIAREQWLQQPEFLKIIRHFLQTRAIPYNDKDSVEFTTDPILSVAATMDIWPGVAAQHLHRDDFIWQQTHNRESPGSYQLGSDVSLGLIVPGVVTTRENGATAFVKGSHLWDHSRRPEADEVAYAEMSLGEAFIFLGSTVHGGGHNSTSKSRTVHGFFYCRSFLRPEENQFLWWTKEEIDKWSDAAKKQAGYVMENPFLGHCNETDPLKLFRARSAVSGF